MILIPATFIARIEAAAIAAYPEECCGMIGGTWSTTDQFTATEIAESANVSSGNRQKEFEVDPQVRFNLMRFLEGQRSEDTQLNGRPLEIIGHYHSHPNGPAMPSGADLRAAHELDFIWIIASVKEGAVNEITAHQLVKCSDTSTETLRFQQIKLRILQD